MEKEYGKLTEDQFKCLVRKLPEIRKQEQLEILEHHADFRAQLGQVGLAAPTEMPI